MDLSTWVAFFVACWFISLSPGAGAISCMSVGMRYGYAKAAWNIAGLVAGVPTVVAVVGAGVGALLVASPTAFEVVRWVGVAYLVWLGVRQIYTPARPFTDSRTADAQATPRQLFWSGYLINITNPKGIAFMAAVLPQFIDPAKPLLMQYVICAATLVFTDYVVMNAFALIATQMMHVLRDERYVNWTNRFFGMLFIVAGSVLAVFKRAV
jgi:homoserine/homoserine lactone efflux protein